MNWRDPKFWDQLSQFGVFLSVVGMFLIARKNKWGLVVILASEPFWFITSAVNRQWGVFALTIVYTVNMIYGIYNWFRKDKLEKTLVSN
ncbi:MAG: nicotinamide mononucleotide transporter family protein [Candidatus Doudnabacteria bacterium]|nr:nicotinamide mononucleotide transporter family protein [Candidatus Doudnabacteria bacterium]